MPRDLTDLTTAHYDLVVVGGGIHGLFAAYDAALRGLSVVLVERDDFGSGLSFNHQRTIHGGLRAIEHGQIAKARQQVHERRTWAVMAPHLIHPLPFLVGTYRWSKRSHLALRMGFALYDRVSRSRNTGIPAELHLPRTKLESRASTVRLFPGIAEEGLSGGAVWYDYQAQHPDRLNWTVALAAKTAGAALANYVEAVSPLVESGHVRGVRVSDRLTGRTYDVQAETTLVAAGGGLGPFLQTAGIDSAPPLLLAANVVIDRPARDLALVAPGRSGRMLTAVPWRGSVVVGTFQSPRAISATVPSEALRLDEMLADANHAFPHLRATPGDVRLVHHGLTPARVAGDAADLLPQPVVLDHRAQGAAGLFSLVGVKFTTARQAAARALDAIARASGKRLRPCSTASRALPHAGIADVEGRLTEALRARRLSLDQDVVAHLGSWYGTEAPAVIAWCADRGLTDRLTSTGPVLAGEISYAAAHADAVHLRDAVLRRTPLGSAGHPGTEALERAADVMGTHVGWSADEKQRQVSGVLERYRQE